LRYKDEITDIDDPIRVDVRAGIPPRLTGLCAECCPNNPNIRTIHDTIAVNVSRSDHGGKEEHFDRTIADLSTVSNARIDGVAEVKAGHNPRRSVLLLCLGEGRKRTVYRRWIRAALPWRHRQTADCERDVVGPEKLPENLRRRATCDAMA
jgi:hypothetical protein